jgi:hypothetical protein
VANCVLRRVWRDVKGRYALRMAWVGGVWVRVLLDGCADCCGRDAEGRA